MGVIEGSRPCSDNDWESIKSGGADAIKKWIAEQLDGKSCAVVLIGEKTAERKWIQYEIIKAWNDNKGIVGVYVHNLLDRNKKQSVKGNNPFALINLGSTTTMLSSLVKAYDPPYTISTSVYNHISNNLAAWVEEAIAIRAKY
jgi:hypothetical protein